MKTYMPKNETFQREWIHIDAEGMTLGRLASTIAKVLMGKHKPTFTPHEDCGDFVIVTNANKFVATGRKLEQKLYSSHSGYPGGFKQVVMKDMLAKHPIRILEKTVKGMLPHTRLGDNYYRKLKVYSTPNHPHTAQKPRTLELSSKGELRYGN